MMSLVDVKNIIHIVNKLESTPESLQKLKDLQHTLTLIRDDFHGYGEFTTRNIKQSKIIVAWEESHKDLIETMESLDLATDTEKEREGLKLKIINIIKQTKPILD